MEFVLIIKYRQISINLPKKTVFGSFFIFILFLFFISSFIELVTHLVPLVGTSLWSERLFPIKLLDLCIPTVSFTIANTLIFLVETRLGNLNDKHIKVNVAA